MPRPGGLAAILAIADIQYLVVGSGDGDWLVLDQEPDQ
jgi:hypothetical protein